ncbi:MAG: T9SS type A sorting domain-containing protein [Bacteroidales bacterium]|nr:T9SS type A sorting domain-containing protein [Bacteroidales bacterium]
MLETLGLKFDDDGLDDSPNQIFSDSDTLLKSIDFKYDGGDSPKFSIDRLVPTSSEVLYKSNDGYNRMFLKDLGESYKVISSAMVMGAYRDADSLSMKAYMMAEMLDYFLGINTITDIEELFGGIKEKDLKVFPNPMTSYTNFSFTLMDKSDVLLTIYDEIGRVVYTAAESDLGAGFHSWLWNARNTSGQAVENGIYFYTIKAEQKIRSGKILLQQ